MKCQHCNANLSCSCQERIASNGKKVCTNCVYSYDLQLKQQKEVLQSYTLKVQDITYKK